MTLNFLGIAHIANKIKLGIYSTLPPVKINRLWLHDNASFAKIDEKLLWLHFILSFLITYLMLLPKFQCILNEKNEIFLEKI